MAHCRLLAVLMLVPLVAAPVGAQSIVDEPDPAAVLPSLASAQVPAIAVRPDTRVRLMVLNEVSTRTTRPGERFVLRVDEDVVVDGATVIPVGSKAWGEVLAASGSGVAGRSGKLSARLLYVEVRGDRVPISGEASSAGNGGTTETVLGVLALGPLGLLARGNNAKLKAGDIFNGYITEALFFDPVGKRVTSVSSMQPAMRSVEPVPPVR